MRLKYTKKGAGVVKIFQMLFSWELCWKVNWARRSSVKGKHLICRVRPFRKENNIHSQWSYVCAKVPSLSTWNRTDNRFSFKLCLFSGVFEIKKRGPGIRFGTGRPWIYPMIPYNISFWKHYLNRSLNILESRKKMRRKKNAKYNFSC